MEIPDAASLAAGLVELGQKSDAVTRCLSALDTGTFTDPTGQIEVLGHVRISRSEAALLAHLSRRCPKPLSIEIGFGMGSSAAIMLGARIDAGEPFEHLIFDPYGLSNNGGAIVEAYLTDHFGSRFRRLREPSAMGMARLWAERGAGSAGLIFIDGSHLFEDVMTDFYFADKLCCVGGAIVFDDALFPAIESVINYITSNRPDYVIHHLIADNTTVAIRVDANHRPWNAFTPFVVPQRENWQASPVNHAVASAARKNRGIRYRLGKWLRKRGYLGPQ